MSRKELAFTTDCELEIVCAINPGCGGDSGYRPGVVGLAVNPSPPEPPEIEDLCVGVIVCGRSIDITGLLTEKEIERIEELCRERFNGGDEE